MRAQTVVGERRRQRLSNEHIIAPRWGCIMITNLKTLLEEDNLNKKVEFIYYVLSEKFHPTGIKLKFQHF